MSAISLLKKPEPQSEYRARRREFERKAKAGCNYDRWGHPCPDCTSDKRTASPRSTTTVPVVRALD